MDEDNNYLSDRERFLEEKSITVGELIELLNKYPTNMKVMSTWESTLHSVQKKNIYISVTGKLYIDCDENFYKGDFAKDSQENED